MAIKSVCKEWVLWRRDECGLDVFSQFLIGQQTLAAENLR
jgi:hypothetical protein